MITIKNIKQSKDASALILLPTADSNKKQYSVSGIIQGEFGFSSKANYSSPFYNETLGKVSGMVNMISSGLQSFFGDLKIPNIALTSVRQTIKTWTMTDSPVFALSLLFVCTEDDDDVRVPVFLLQKTAYPTFQNIGESGIGTALYMNAPNNYQVIPSQSKKDFGITANGLCLLSLGEWFIGRNLLLTNVDPKFSEEKNWNGSPMWALVSVAFEPFRMLDASDIQDMYPSLNLDNNKFSGRNLR